MRIDADGNSAGHVATGVEVTLDMETVLADAANGVSPARALSLLSAVEMDANAASLSATARPSMLAEAQAQAAAANQASEFGVVTLGDDGVLYYANENEQQQQQPNQQNQRQQVHPDVPASLSWLNNEEIDEVMRDQAAAQAVQVAAQQAAQQVQ